MLSCNQQTTNHLTDVWTSLYRLSPGLSGSLSLKVQNARQDFLTTTNSVLTSIFCTPLSLSWILPERNSHSKPCNSWKRATTTVVLRPFSLHTQGLAGGSTQQPSPPLPILRIFLFQPALSLMSLSTTWLHVIFGLPRPLLPSTSNDMIFFTQSSSSFRSTRPNYLNLFRFTASDTDSIPILFFSSALGTISLSDTPHIYLTILISIRSNLPLCSAVMAHVS